MADVFEVEGPSCRWRVAPRICGASRIRKILLWSALRSEAQRDIRTVGSNLADVVRSADWIVLRRHHVAGVPSRTVSKLARAADCDGERRGA
jgi:hypothetical protein